VLNTVKDNETHSLICLSIETFKSGQFFSLNK
jgi:hypothetical protein